jgi:hypothetical protein
MNTTRRETVVSVKLQHELPVLFVKSSLVVLLVISGRLSAKVSRRLISPGSLDQAISMSLMLLTLIISKVAVHDG